MIKFEEFGKEVHAICCTFDGAERVGIAAIEALSDFARRENDAELNRPSVVALASLLPPQLIGRLKRHAAKADTVEPKPEDDEPRPVVVAGMPSTSWKGGRLKVGDTVLIAEGAGRLHNFDLYGARRAEVTELHPELAHLVFVVATMEDGSKRGQWIPTDAIDGVIAPEMKTEDGALSISVGHSYEDGYGDRIRIDCKYSAPGLASPFRGNNLSFYAANGRCNGADRRLDLVREVEPAEPITAPEDDPYAPPEKLETDPDARTLTKSEAAALKAAADEDLRFVKMVDVKIGETYLRRDGVTTTILREDENRDYPPFMFKSTHGVSYNADGGWHPSGIKHEFDLVAHVPKATAEPTPTTTADDAGAVTFHEPEGVEPFDQVGADEDDEQPSTGHERPEHAVLTEPLEVGKLYRRRDGETEEICSRDQDANYPFIGDSFNSYTKYGTIYMSAGMENDADLVTLID